MSLVRQRGVVIVVALFIVALIAAMAYVMMARLARDTERTILLVRDTEANVYAQASVIWAIDQLRFDWEKRQQNKLIDATPIQSPVQHEQGYEVVSTIYDMQARFNLNNLTTKEAQQQFKRLLLTVNPKMSSEQAIAIVRATAEWIKAGGKDSEFGKYYSQLSMPYRSASKPMITVSEFRLVKGVTPVVYDALSPYLTALPGATKINVQTASTPILMLLGSNLTMAAVKQIEALRKSSPFVTEQDFLKLDIVKNNQIANSQITAVSNYFLVETKVSIENQHLVLYTLLMRRTKDRQATVNILWQSRGAW